MDILTKKNNVKNNIYPLSYSADMDDFAMTYGHFMNALEMYRNVQKTPCV